jgi:hypothetical protein
MNKDYKLMAGLIPIILVLSIALYLFPNASGLNAEIAAPILNQTDNSSLNQSSLNTSETQVDNPATQNSQDTSDNYYTPPDNTDGNTDTGNTSEPSNPDDTTDPTNTTI